MEDVMTNRFWMLALMAISFTGCYTSFTPREYEQESYGQYDENYYESPETAAYYDSLDFLDEEYLYDDPQEITIINNYPPEWGWDYYSPVYVSVGYSPWGRYYDPFYDSYCSPYYTPYYRPYYSGIYVYGDYYYGGYGSSYYPSDTKYRNNTRHWTSLRNNGGRHVANRGREASRGTSTGRSNTQFSDNIIAKGFDLDRDLRVTRTTGRSGSSTVTRTTGLRTASIRKSGEIKTADRKTDIYRRRISKTTKDKIVRKDRIRTSKSESQRVTKRSQVSSRTKKSSSTKNRSKRVYSSNNTSKRSSDASRSYHRPSTRSSNRSSNVSQSTRNSKSTSQSYSSPSRSSSRNSSSTRSSYSGNSGSSSRSSVSRSSGSSSRSSGNSSSRSSSSSKSSSRGRR